MGHATQGNKIGIAATNTLAIRAIDGGSVDTTLPFSTGDSIACMTRDEEDKIDVSFNDRVLNRLFSDAAQAGTAIWNLLGADASGFKWDGPIADILIYDRKLSEVEKTIVFNKLGNIYSIPVILPKSIGGLTLLLDSTDETTLTSNDLNPNLIKQQLDKVTYSNKAVQDTTTSQPTFTELSMGLTPALQFDGGDKLVLTSDIVLPADYSIFMTLKADVTTQTRVALGHSADDVRIGMINPNLLHIRTVDGGSSDTSQTFAVGDAVIYLTRDTANKVDVAFNGGALNRLFADVAQVGSVSWNTIGGTPAGSSWRGSIGDVLIYDRALAETEAAEIIALLKSKRGIP